ncbi:MAG: DNA repair protein RadC [Bacteroidales bacterium]|nr:DNA repair protein RadC [Bacteroidales bacterium]MBN2818776.1 DNA repair protein RadC [Bacteroidales bacterium]
MTYTSIKNWSADERPRERLALHGARTLSDAELLAILLGSGTRELSAVELSRKVLSLSNNNLSELGKLTVADFKSIKGIGEAKAITIAAALELGRRRSAAEPEQKVKITDSKLAAGIFQNLLCDLNHEEFWVACLSRSNSIIEKFQVSQGGISGTLTDIRIIMKRCLEMLASSVIICHNHPSGNLTPSEQDKEITQKVKEASKFFDIKLLDHIIIAGNKYYSFADEGLV